MAFNSYRSIAGNLTELACQRDLMLLGVRFDVHGKPFTSHPSCPPPRRTRPRPQRWHPGTAGTRNEIVHVGLGLSELHLVHTLTSVPVKEGLAAEHASEL